MACSLRSEQEAKYYLKITLARRKTRTEAARPSFPGDTSFTQGGFWLSNEEQLPFAQRHFSLSLVRMPLASNPSFSHYHSLFPPLRHLPKLQPPHSTHTIPPGLGWLRFMGLGVPSSDQKVRGSYSQSQAPNCFGWEDGYVSWWVGEQKVLHSPKNFISQKIPFMLKSRELGGLLMNINVSALSAGMSRVCSCCTTPSNRQRSSPCCVKGLAARTSVNSSVNKSFWIL